MTNALTYEGLLRLAGDRHSTRYFSRRAVNGDLIHKIIAVANTSPYASGRKNWGIKVIDDQSVIMAAARDVETTVNGLSSEIHPPLRDEFVRYSQNFTVFRTAPVLLIPYFRIAPVFELMMDPCPQDLLLFDRDTMVKSISCVSMLITLAAESLGLSSCYVTGALIAEPALRSRFDIPNGRHIGAIIPIGYEDE